MHRSVLIVWSVLIFSARWVSSSLLKQILKYNLVFAIYVFDDRRYDGAYLSCAYVPHSIKFTEFIDESVEKIKSISSKHGRFKILS